MPESIDPTSDRPVYRQIADQLRQAIREGRYGEGDALPSETALAETYGVTRMTARQAMDVLKGEGLVRSEHGRGVFVRSRPTVRRLARNRFTKAWRESGGTGRGAYDVEMRQLGLEPGVELVELGPVTPPSEIAERLGLKAGDKALIRRRQMYAGGQPMQLATSYVPWSFAEGTQMVERDSGPGGIYSRLADVGHGPVRFAEEVATRMPTPEEARFLRLTDPQPVFNLFRTASMCPGHRSRSANMSCRVIAGCSPMSGQPSSAAGATPDPLAAPNRVGRRGLRSRRSSPRGCRRLPSPTPAR